MISQAATTTADGAAAQPAGDAVTVFERHRTELRAQQRIRTIIGTILFVLALVGSSIVGEVRLVKFVEGLPGFFNYIKDTLPPMAIATLGRDIAEWYWALWKWLGLLVDTIFIAFLGTLLGTAGALALCFPASHNLMQNRTIYFVSRRIAEVARAVPELVYAMIFVFAYGLGPLAGVLAIAVHTSGALGKLFAEVNENIDQKQIDGVLSSGANWFQTIRLAVIPQVLPNYASYGLLRFEINVRGAAVIGFVGAGGIGQELLFVIRQFVYVDVSAIVLMIILTVSVIDMSCERLRHCFIGEENF